MRRRATFIHDGKGAFDPADIELTPHRLSHPGIGAAREERLTYNFAELPAELIDVLKQSHELHIRWVSEIPYNVQVPYVSALTAGLHVHYTPLGQQQNDLLCQTLKDVFSKSLDCKSPEASFTQQPLVSERFASAASLQYYSILPEVAQLVAYIQRKICRQSDLTCFHHASLLNVADYIDMDFDSISHALTISAFWSKPLTNYYDPVSQEVTANRWPLDIPAQTNDKIEVGILNVEKATEPHEFQLEGFLAVVGQDDHPKPTMFSFPSRHHTLPSSQLSAQTYTVDFSTPVGLHPTLQVIFPSKDKIVPPSSKPADSTCALHAYFTFPSAIFADQYAFPTTVPDPLFEAAHNIRLLRSISGELDLEAPDYVIDKWGSTMLLELSTPVSPSNSDSDSKEKDTWTVSIPLHLRYLPPSQSAGSVGCSSDSQSQQQKTTENKPPPSWSSQSHRSLTIPWPNLFWACTSEEGTKFPVNPFDRINLGYDSLFGPRTMFYHLKPNPSIINSNNNTANKTNGKLTTTINVPILDTSKVGSEDVIQWGTLVVVLIGFAWVVGKMVPAFRDGFENYNKIGNRQGDDKKDRKDEKKKKTI